ncbi:helix-turn-helix domain-containing protein [Bradyrhizobium lablabi]|uniref:helix-turn-helix domain-containing protein n=1 Tax=Bradyrhizobium lablabi TaxID=722472 RepID=UPI0009A903F6
MASHRPIATGTRAPSPRQSNVCRDLVEETENLALAEVDGPLHISALCVALAVSERTLRKAFHKAYGLPPCRHLRMLRLSRARRALLSADSKLVTVTEIATCFGFVELGRFSVEYRKVFGESPSQTLHHAFPERTVNVAVQ